VQVANMLCKVQSTKCQDCSDLHTSVLATVSMELRIWSGEFNFHKQESSILRIPGPLMSCEGNGTVNPSSCCNTISI
jgi:hypothetical protein